MFSKADKMLNRADMRLFQKYTGRFLVKFIGLDIEAEAFGKDWTLLEFILTAWKHLTGEDRREMDPEEESQRWRITTCSFLGAEGVVHTGMKYELS